MECKEEKETEKIAATECNKELEEELRRNSPQESRLKLACKKHSNLFIFMKLSCQR